MEKRNLGKTGLQIMPLVFGGNVFGWTTDEAQSFAVLDAFVDHGFNAIDTADCYSAWVPGNKGGESETIIGKWLKARPGIRDKVTIFTKVGSVTGGPHPGGLTAGHILPACDASLARLGIDEIDLYFAHWPDPQGTTYEETLAAFGALEQAGKVRAIAVSNVDADQLSASIKVARDNNLPTYQVLQPEYNLYNREKFEGALQDLCIAEDIGVVTYFSLASGFLSGKYRSADDLGQSARGAGIAKYLTPKGTRILDALDSVSAAHNATPAQIALAWVMAQPGVSAPIASATTVAQVESFARAAEVRLANDEIALLNQAGA